MYVRVVRWAEAIFIVFEFAILMFLPFPPHGEVVVSYVTTAVGIVAAAFVWWGLRFPARQPWLVAAILAALWTLRSVWNAVLFIQSAIGITQAATRAHGIDPAFLVVLAIGSLPAVCQLVVLCVVLKSRAALRAAQRASP